MNQELKDKIRKANTLMNEIESLAIKIEVYEDFKIDEELDCKITRSESKKRDDYSYIQNIYVADKDIIVEVISRVQTKLKLELEAKESELKEYLKQLN
jgi:hypothetical protein